MARSTMQFQNGRVAAHANAMAKNKGRIHNEATGEFLHCSGKSLTKDIHQSWLGFSYQAARVYHVAKEADVDLTNFMFRRRHRFEGEN